MTKKNGTKRSLLMSAVALVLCFSMLVGSTFAWFTDSVTSSGNIIKSGNLDVTMEWAEGDAAVPAVADDAAWTDASDDAIFDYDLWEPGYVDAKHIKIANEGSLAFNYQLHIVPNGTVSALANVIDVYFGDPAAAATRDLTGMRLVGTLADLIKDTDGAAYGKLYPAGTAGEESTKIVTIALKMQESAGNEYQELSIGTDFSVQLIANQLTYEKDSFGSDYDTDAEWPVVATGFAPVANSGATTIYVKDEKTPSMTIATVQVPEGAADEEASKIVVTVIETEKHHGVTVTSQQASVTYDVTVTGLKEGNTDLVKVELYVGKGLTGVTVYHDGILMEDPDPINNPGMYAPSYNPHDGVVTFYSATFSPFTVVYDAESEYVPPVTDGEAMPVATVNVLDTTGPDPAENESWLDGGSFVGASAMKEGQTLVVAYEFVAPHNSDNIDECAYRDWYCDFYVSIALADDEVEDLPADVLFLGGSYGTFGWVGFNNPSVPVNEEIPMLQSVAKNPWTYADIATSVGKFICGVNRVADVDSSILDGATFTVKLCLVDPSDETATPVPVTLNIVDGNSNTTASQIDYTF